MKDPILILHGWMVSPNRYQKLESILQSKGYRVYIPEMPGFGKTPLITDPMHVDDYVLWIYEYIKKNKLRKVIVIGHSFGGRIGAKLAFSHPESVGKLILTGAPLIKQPLSLKKKMMSQLARGGKKLVESFPRTWENIAKRILYRILGEYDYYHAGHMQHTFVAINNEDLASILPDITVSTLVIWGEQERVVVLSVGRAISLAIPGAVFISIKECGHKLPYENPTAFAAEVLAFLQRS